MELFIKRKLKKYKCYDDFVRKSLSSDSGFITGAVPFFGWLFTVYFFGFHYPIKYLFQYEIIYEKIKK